jgi:GNAT superfamily N-acetyltransferase
MQEVIVRAARRSDLATLVGFACAMARETEGKALDRETVRSGILRLFDEPSRGRYLVAEVGDQLVGALMITLEWSDWRCADWWWIQSVYVVTGMRRMGVYRALHKAVHREALATPGVCGLRLYVERANAPAQQAYRSLDMQDSGYNMYELAVPVVR